MGKNDLVLGPILLAVVIVIVLPISFFIIGGGVAALYGYLFPDYIDEVNAGSELIELNQ